MVTKKNKGITIWNKNFILCIAVTTTAFFGHSMFNPVLPIYAASLGISTDIIGSVVAIAMLLCMFGRAYIGGVSDHVNKKKLVMVSLCILLSGYICYLFADTIQLILIAKILQSVGQGLTTTVLSILAFSYIPQEKLGSAIGIFSLSTSLASSLAPLIGTNIAESGRFPLLFLISLIMTIISIFVMTQIKTSDMPSDTFISNKYKFKISDFICRPAIPAALMVMLNGIVFSSISNYMSIYGISIGIKQIGIFFTINSIVLLITRPIVGRLGDSKPMTVLMIPAYLLTIIACVMISTAKGLPLICIAAVLYGYGFGTSQAAIQIIALRSVGPEKRGAANGTFYVGGDIGLSTGSFISGHLAKNIGYPAMYQAMAAVAALALMFFICYQTYNFITLQKI